MKFERVLFGWFVLFALLVPSMQTIPAFAQQSPPPPPPPDAGMEASPPPDWPAEFRRPRNPEDMRRWQQHEGSPPDRHAHRHFSPDEQQALRRDLNRARREIYRDWRAWPLRPPTLPPASPPLDHSPQN